MWDDSESAFTNTSIQYSFNCLILHPKVGLLLHITLLPYGLLRFGSQVFSSTKILWGGGGGLASNVPCLILHPKVGLLLHITLLLRFLWGGGGSLASNVPWLHPCVPVLCIPNHDSYNTNPA